MSGPAGVIALLLAETAAGGSAILFLSPLWREVRPGFFLLVGVVMAALAAGAFGATAAASDPKAGASGVAGALALALAATALAWSAAVATRPLRSAGRALGAISVPLSAAMLVAFAATAGGSFGLALFEVAAGAAFTGAVLDGLLLGHWYLTDRRLTRGPINRMAWTLIAAVIVEAAAVISASLGPAPRTGLAASNSLNPILTISGSGSLIAIGMVACTALVAVMIKLTLRGARPQAVQSATGFFYLATITAFVAELAAKVRFLS